MNLFHYRAIHPSIARFLTCSMTFLFIFAFSPRAQTSPQKPQKSLQIYFVDVEGGQATLFVTPAGESLLIDTGWPGNEGRDANRIVAAAKDAGIARRR